MDLLQAAIGHRQLDLGGALLGWLLQDVGRASFRGGKRLLLGDPQQQALRQVVESSATQFTEQVAGLDAQQRSHLRSVLISGTGGGPGVDSFQVSTEADIRRALAGWAAELDRPQLGGAGYLTSLGLTAESVSEALADSILSHIVDDARRGGPLGTLAEWLWRAETRNQLNQMQQAIEDRHISAPVPRPNEIDLASPCFQLPRAPRKLFVGRKSEERGFARLTRKRSGGLHIEVICGMGGVGKTELALRHAHKIRDRYQVTWWITADSSHRVQSSLADLARRICPGLLGTLSTADSADWAMAWLQTHANWLLVLDDVESGALLDQFAGQLLNGHILVTSRQRIGWEEIGGNVTHLRPLTQEEAAEYLMSASGDASRLNASQLADELGCLPLALTQAAAYISDTRTSTGAYLEVLSAHQEKLLSETTASISAKRAVSRTWSVSFRAVRRRDPEAVGLLRVLCHFASAEIPREIIEVDNFDFPTLHSTLGLLNSYSIIDLTDSVIKIHRIIKMIVLNDLDSSSADDTLARTTSRRDAIDRAWTMLRKAMPADPSHNTSGWPRWRAMMPHIEELTQQMPASTNTQVAFVLNQAGHYCSSQGEDDQALELYRRSTAIMEATRGQDDLDTALYTLNTATHLTLMGSSLEAVPMLERALAVIEKELGSDNPDVLDLYPRLALAFRKSGQIESAIEILERTISQKKKSQQPPLPDCLGELAQCYLESGRAEDAIGVQRQAVELTEAQDGSDHPHTAYRLLEMAFIYARVDGVDESIPLIRRAVRILGSWLGASHPSLVATCDSVVIELERAGRFEEAVPYREMAVRAIETNSSSSYSDVGVMRLLELSSRLRQIGSADRALLAAEQAVENAEAAQGSRHPDYELALAGLAAAHYALGNFEEALGLQRRAMRELQENPKANPGQLSSLARNMARSLTKLGNLAEAIPLQKHAVRLAIEQTPQDLTELAVGFGDLGINLLLTGAISEAKTVFEQAISVARGMTFGARGALVVEWVEVMVSMSEKGRRREALVLAEYVGGLGGSAHGADEILALVLQICADGEH